MLAGDQLILCSPEEMKRELQQLHSAKVETSTDAGADSAAEQAGRGNSARVLPWVGRSRQKPASENAPVEVAPVAVPAPVVIPPSPESTPTTTPEIAEPEQKKAPKSWLQRLLSPDPPQPRKAEREAIQGLAAFYFNGGDSVAHGVRDISPTGFYVLTEERWYLGTIIRMTLTDRQQAGSERSVTVNASVVRWGNDGVGLQFVCADGKDQRRNKSLSMDGMLPGASKAELEQFVRRLKSGTN